MNRWIN